MDYNELRRRAEIKLQEIFAGQNGKDVQLAACKTVVPAIICTLIEYEKMKQETETSE